MMNVASEATTFPALARLHDKRIPSDRQFAARHANASRIATMIAAQINGGHRVFDGDGDELVGIDLRLNGDIVYRFREGGNVIMFLNDKTWDNGAMDSVADYNASFAGWSFVHPQDFKPLKV